MYHINFSDLSGMLPKYEIRKAEDSCGTYGLGSPQINTQNEILHQLQKIFFHNQHY